MNRGIPGRSLGVPDNFATNQFLTQWDTVFGDEVLAAAILDRLLHHSHTLMIQPRRLVVLAVREQLLRAA